MANKFYPIILVCYFVGLIFQGIFSAIGVYYDAGGWLSLLYYFSWFVLLFPLVITIGAFSLLNVPDFSGRLIVAIILGGILAIVSDFVIFSIRKSLFLKAKRKDVRVRS